MVHRIDIDWDNLTAQHGLHGRSKAKEWFLGKLKWFGFTILGFTFRWFITMILIFNPLFTNKCLNIIASIFI